MRSIITLIAFVFLCNITNAQVPYGNNPSVGKYIQSGDAKIYYEVYGEGEPLLLLHGGYYGYISEFGMYLPTLTKNFKVIAVATRGHGKSEIGHTRMSYRLWANDAYNVLQNEGIESALVMGFSDGAMSGAVLAHNHPECVKKLVFMGGALNSHHSNLESMRKLFEMTGENESNNLPDFLKQRLLIMPEPNRFAEWVEMMIVAWKDPIILTNNEAEKIKCETLIVIGDRDDYTSVEGSVDIYRLIPNSQLLIWPNANHVNLIFNEPMFNNVVMPYLLKN